MQYLPHWLLCLLLFATSETALAVCNLPQPRLVRAEYSQSDAVVIAHLVKSRHIVPKNDQDYYLYTFQVEKMLRGTVPDQFVLWDENSSGRLTFDVLKGSQYLLFLEHWSEGSVQTADEKSWWVADGCGNSGEVSKAARTLKEIQRIPSLRDALITGQVRLSAPAAHAKVVAVRKSDGKRFATQTRDDGKFNLNVPAGEYSVKAAVEGKSLVADYLSYEKAESVKLENGGCAQIQF